MVVSLVEDLTPSFEKIHTAIIGCGNSNRSDDGAGSAVIRLLSVEPLPTGVAAYDAGTDGMSVMYRAKNLSRLIIVDARIPETNPGAVFEVPGEVLRAEPEHSINLHDFRWDHALYAGRKIYADRFPEDVSVFLIEAQSLAFGLRLTPLVEAAVQTVAKKIKALILPVSKQSKH